MWTMSKDEICEIENISVGKGHIFIDFFFVIEITFKGGNFESKSEKSELISSEK